MHASPFFADAFPFQKAGIEYLCAHTRALLADQQGLGKTFQTIRAANAAHADSWLVICPAVARPVWRDMIAKWSMRAVHADITSYDFWARGSMSGQIDKAQMLKKRWELLIIDEAHYLKSPSAKRTQAIYGVGCNPDIGRHVVLPHAQKVWLLSGTPTPNAPHELWTHLRALWPELIPGLDYDSFINRYCTYWVDERGKYRITGTVKQHMPELRNIARKISLRRLKKDVLPDLPPLMTELVPLAPDDWREMRLLEEKLQQVLDSIDVDTINNNTAAGVRRELGLAKAPLAADYCRDVLHGGCPKLVVFAWHRDVIRYLAQALDKYNPVNLTGQTPDTQRAAIVRRFQEDSSCQLFIGQIQAAGTAITLTAADRVVFAETSWVPGDNAQAMERCHRIGTRNSVLASFLHVKDSIDEAIQRTLMVKMSNIRQLWG